MTVELAVFSGVLALLLLLAFSIWRSSRVTQAEFFPSQRARVLRAVRLRAGGLFAVAVVALLAQFMVSQQQQQAIEQKEQRLLQYESELLRLRVDYELARNRLASVASVSATRAEPASKAGPAAQAQELAQVSVPRAVVRDSPAGRAQFVLTSGARVRLQGVPADGSGRAWREALTDDGRHGWIAVEVLTAVEG